MCKSKAKEILTAQLGVLTNAVKRNAIRDVIQLSWELCSPSCFMDYDGVGWALHCSSE